MTDYVRTVHLPMGHHVPTGRRQQFIAAFCGKTKGGFRLFTDGLPLGLAAAVSVRTSACGDTMKTLLVLIWLNIIVWGSTLVSFLTPLRWC